MGSDIIPDAELDCVGHYCPIPIAQTKEELDNDLALDAGATMWF